jgi:CheY-like chemotaxis protein
MSWVMVVEDDPDIRACVREILEDEGYSVCTAAHGAEALAMLATGGRPCLMLVDLLMPVMDGVELIERLRHDRDLGDIPIVALSAAATVEVPEGTPLLRKPVGYDAILEVVEARCRRSSDRG